MALSGETYTSYLRTNVLPVAEEAIYYNNFLFGPESPFEVVGPNACPGGDSIDILIDTSVSSNVAVYTVGDPMPTPDTTTTVQSIFYKDLFQGTAKTYDIYKMFQANGGAYAPLGDQDQKAIQQVANGLRDLAITTMLGDAITWIDSTSAFSDAALSRTTYPSLASGEVGSVGTLAKADLDLAIETMENGTYQKVKRSDMVFLMPINQIWNAADVLAGVSGTIPWSLSAQADRMDIEATAKMATYGTVPIVPVPDLTSTNILLVDRNAVKIFNWAPLTITPKDVAAAEQSWLLTFGASLVITNPARCYKLDGITP